MDARRIIARLRDGETPSREELRWFANGLADFTVSDAQAGAFAMAALLNGLTEEGRVALTLAMRDSGDVLTWRLDRPVVDKHSTGGIGDCVSLVLAPALAACGVYVPMISGRGLGHTGGTLDKIEAIPGVQTGLDEATFRNVVKDAGVAIVSASARIAPADKRLYAIRDVTATVESLDLITASILAKKLAAGLDGLILDVKVGSGAFMKSRDDAEALARSLVNTAKAAGCPTTAVISDMNQPLAPALGNALEVAEVMKALTTPSHNRLTELTAILGGGILAQTGISESVQDGADSIMAEIRNGRAAEAFGKMIAAQGGPVRFVEQWAHFLPEATVIREVTAWTDGYITAYDGEQLGLVVVALGGGRQVENDVVNPSVGLSDILPLGASVLRGQPIARIHAAREDAADQAEAGLRAALEISERSLAPPPLIHEWIG